MIKTFGDELTSSIFDGSSNRQIARMDSSLLRQIKRRLDVLNAATRMEDLMVNPANRFHALSGDLNGFYSIAVNKQ